MLVVAMLASTATQAAAPAAVSQTGAPDPLGQASQLLRKVFGSPSR
jgi:hypothetical protein